MIIIIIMLINIYAYKLVHIYLYIYIYILILFVFCGGGGWGSSENSRPCPHGLERGTHVHPLRLAAAGQCGEGRDDQSPEIQRDLWVLGLGFRV